MKPCCPFVMGGAALLAVGGGYMLWANSQANAEAKAKADAALAAQQKRESLGTKAEARIVAFAKQAREAIDKRTGAKAPVPTKTAGMMPMGQLSNGGRGLRLVA